jgi:predicted nucleic acid-binding protein
MNVALDTNAVTRFMRGESSCVRIVQTANRLVIPLFVLAELRAGFAAGNRQSSNEANLRRFLNTPRVEVLLPDERTASHYAQLFVQLRMEGTPIPTNDLWIAALVLQHDLILCTSDSHFQHLPQLPTC